MMTLFINLNPTKSIKFVVPTGTRNDHQMNVDESDIDESDLNENFEVVQAMNAFLDYDSEDEDAMNAVLDL